MSPRLFSVPKVGLFVDAVALGKEKRKDGEEVTVLRVTFRAEPFDAALANAIDDGLGGDSNVRASVFKLHSAEPKPHLERVNFSLDCPRQRIDLYASPDTDSSRLCFDQAKIGGVYVRTSKDTAGLALVCTASFGPVGRDELEACAQYFRAQVFATFHAAEPGLDFEDADGDADPIPPAPMWDDGDEATETSTDATEVVAESLADREKRSRPTAKRGTRSKRAKHDPEAEHAHQVEAGQAKRKPNGAVSA